jgi:hypothetical protein
LVDAIVRASATLEPSRDATSGAAKRLPRRAPHEERRAAHCQGNADDTARNERERDQRRTTDHSDHAPYEARGFDVTTDRDDVECLALRDAMPGALLRGRVMPRREQSPCRVPFSALLLQRRCRVLCAEADCLGGAFRSRLRSGARSRRPSACDSDSPEA